LFRFHGAQEVWIVDPFSNDEVDAAACDVLQAVDELVLVVVVTHIVDWFELDEEVDVAACGVEVVADGGAEDGEAADVVGAAEFGDLFALCF
jgi:hypothetical protein